MQNPEIKRIQDSLTKIQEQKDREEADKAKADVERQAGFSKAMTDTFKRIEARARGIEQQKRATAAAQAKRKAKTLMPIVLGKDVIAPVVEDNRSKDPYPEGISLASGTENEVVSSTFNSMSEKEATEHMTQAEAPLHFTKVEED